MSKASPRFKVGDKVVNLTKSNTTELNIYLEIGTTVTVMEESFYPYIEDSLGRTGCLHQEELELEEIWNSPLYKTMREHE